MNLEADSSQSLPVGTQLANTLISVLRDPQKRSLAEISDQQNFEIKTFIVLSHSIGVFVVWRFVAAALGD